MIATAQVWCVGYGELKSNHIAALNAMSVIFVFFILSFPFEDWGECLCHIYEQVLYLENCLDLKIQIWRQN